MATTQYKVTVTPKGGKPETRVLDGRDALRDALLRAGISATGDKISAASHGPVVEKSSSVGSYGTEVRFVALGWKLSGHGGTTAQVLTRVAQRIEPMKTPNAFRHAVDGSTSYTAKDGSARRASFWSGGPQPHTVWAVDVTERRYVLLAPSDGDTPYREISD